MAFTFEDLKKQQGTQVVRKGEAGLKGVSRGIGISTAKALGGLTRTGQKIIAGALTAPTLLPGGKKPGETFKTRLGQVKERVGAKMFDPDTKIGQSFIEATTALSKAEKGGELIGEIAQFAGPGGAIVKGGKLAQATIKGGSKAPTLARKFAGRLGRAGTEGIGFGGVEVARTGEADKEALAVAGITAGLSIIGGALSGGKSVITKKLNKLNPTDKTGAIERLSKAYDDSFVADKSSINNKLDVEVVKSRRFGGPKTKQELVKELASDGYLPKIEGELANMRPAIDDMANRRGVLAGKVDRFLEPVKTKTSLKSLQTKVEGALQEDFGIDIEKTIRQSNQMFKAFEKRYGKNLTAKQINDITRELNRKTKAFDKETFVQDSANTIGRVMRERINEVAPSNVVKGINSEIARLFRLENTARIFHNKKIDAGFFGETTGRFLGTLAGASAGIGIAGPGGLVIAGGLANLGSKAVAKLIRQARFSPKTFGIIKKELNRDLKLKNKLLKEATPEDRKIIESLFQKSSKNLGDDSITAKSKTTTNINKPIIPKTLPKKKPKVKSKLGETKKTPVKKTLGGKPTQLNNLTAKTKKYESADDFDIALGKLDNDLMFQKKILENLESNYLEMSGKKISSANTKAMIEKARLKAFNQRKIVEEMKKKDLKVGGKPTQLNNLTEEAKKYKSADEFVKAQPKVYHGTNTEFDKFDIEKGISKTSGRFEGFHFGTKSQTKNRGDKFVKEVFLDIKKSKRTKDIGERWDEVIEKAKKSGFDSIVYLNRFEGMPPKELKAARLKIGGNSLDSLSDADFKKIVPSASDSFLVFEPSQIKTKSQLKEIWEKANKK